MGGFCGKRIRPLAALSGNRRLSAKFRDWTHRIRCSPQIRVQPASRMDGRTDGRTDLLFDQADPQPDPRRTRHFDTISIISVADSSSLIRGQSCLPVPLSPRSKRRGRLDATRSSPLHLLIPAPIAPDRLRTPTQLWATWALLQPRLRHKRNQERFPSHPLEQPNRIQLR